MYRIEHAGAWHASHQGGPKLITSVPAPRSPVHLFARRHRELFSRHPPQAELIAGADRLVIAEMDLDRLFAVDRGPRFVGESRDDFLAGDLNDVAGGGIGIVPVEAERHPARLFADFNAGDLPRGH